MAFLILNTFQAVLDKCPAVASTSSVAAPALSPNLFDTILVVAFVVAESACFSAASAASRILSAIVVYIFHLLFLLQLPILEYVVKTCFYVCVCVCVVFVFVFVLWHLLTASNEAKRTCPGTMERKAFPACDFITGPITDPEATPTMSSIDLLSFSVIFDRFLTLNQRT